MLIEVQEDMSSEPVLKVWALDKLVKKTNMPTCLSTVSINNNRRQFPVRSPMWSLTITKRLTHTDFRIRGYRRPHPDSRRIHEWLRHGHQRRAYPRSWNETANSLRVRGAGHRCTAYNRHETQTHKPFRLNDLKDIEAGLVQEGPGTPP
jgi:hypothetical protein